MASNAGRTRKASRGLTHYRQPLVLLTTHAQVTTYGKKKTQIIAIHSDLNLDSSPARSAPIRSSSFVPSPSPVSPPASSKRTNRPPLKTKASQDTVGKRSNIPLLSVSQYQKLDEPAPTPSPPPLFTPVKSGMRMPSSSPETEEEVVRPARFRRARRIATRSPSTSASPATVKAEPRKVSRKVSATAAKPLFDGIEIVSKKRVTSGSSLVDRFAKITIDLTESDDSFTTAPETGEVVPIEDLLHVCSFTRICPFSGFLSSAAFSNLLSRSGAEPKVRKIGEATYSEVFGVRSGIQEVVVKIIPLENEGPIYVGDKDLPDLSSVRDVLREIETTKHMTGLEGGGFVEFLGSYVVRGAYPAALLAEWDRFEAAVGSESIRPDGFLSSQRYAMVVLGDGGPDLEAFKFDKPAGWVQAAGIFWQVASALARAEEWARFEHRDLHEGQVLITTCSTDSHHDEVDYLSPTSCGIRATIIDFGLSRLDIPSKGPVWTALPMEVFEGVGDQWDVYRSMRERVEDWEAFHPVTNILWLRYLLSYILHSKGLRRPRPKSMKAPARVPLQPTKRMLSGTRARTVSANHKPPPSLTLKDTADSAYEMLHGLEVMLGGTAKKGKGKKDERDLPFSSASKLVSWARDRDWLR